MPRKALGWKLLLLTINASVNVRLEQGRIFQIKVIKQNQASQQDYNKYYPLSSVFKKTKQQ